MFLHSIKKEIPDIIMMDIKLGKNENGISIVQKRFKKHNSIPILYLTAFSDDATMQRCI